MSEGIETKIGEAGIIDDQLGYDFKQAQFVKEEKEDPNAVREVTIRVPAHIPDQVVHNAWQVGMGTVQRLGMGLMVIAFPSVAKGPQGQPVNAIGKFEVLLSKAEDVQRILELAKVINDVNQQIAEAAQRPSDLLEVTVKGRQIKDEALRQSKQLASGETPIIMAQKQPQAAGKKPQIQLAR